ncbi:chaperone DnaJ protein [Angomonas deanei]|uniref:DnaJ domain containing protein, putative n=1 Tax=Angomonas deanei TaxID=59799 RepID=A0A7G2C2P2_9TRYP|nr:chaperone DnaJ protein [Angomonas deanei]CAD2213471.1 DnaJ domain containing protein, putative [Angomonas deanei]|eukprot:EPY41217.1 chaperone DnaJ protein [Angomonas deanei]
MLRRSLRLFAVAGQGPFDPYKILGVSPNASKNDIKKAYRRLALRFHPDSGPEGNNARFQAVNEAYEALKDGKWTPAQSKPDGTAQGGHGWDPKMRMYVYEQPGSTKDGYVNGQTETILKVIIALCFTYVLVKLGGVALSGPKKAPGEGALNNIGESTDESSVHSDEIRDFQFHSENEATEERGLAVDPLSRR